MRSTAVGFTEQNGLEKIVDGVPIGTILPYAGSTAPFGSLICNGAAISRSAYPELFEAIGTTWGAGDGTTTFNIPDLRGYFLRGVGGNSAALAVEQGDAIRNMTGIVGFGTERLFNVASGVFEGNLPTTSNPGGISTGDTSNPHNPQYVSAKFNASRVVPTAAENRPINKAVNYIIVYE